MSKKHHVSKKGFGDTPSYGKVTPKTFNKWQKRAVYGDIDAQIKVTNFYRSQWNKISYREDSTFIHEKDYEPMNCCLCGMHMPSIHDTHNPYPFTKKCTAKESLEENLPHRCCTTCNALVSDKRRKDAIERGDIRPDDKGTMYVFDWMNHIMTDEVAEGTQFLVPFMSSDKKQKEEV